jgi:predicted DNA-binding transcriptional regulator YafY
MDDVLDALLTGVLSRRIVRFAYRDARGRTRRGHLAALTMALYKHGLYVIGCPLPDASPRGEARLSAGSAIAVHAVERFTEAHALRTTFTAPPGFRIADMLHGAFGIHVATTDQAPHRVVVEFAAAVAAFAGARTWHPTQEVERLPDGRIRLAFTCANLTPIVSWVLEWGPQARALEPPALVAQVVAELDAARAAYR